MRKETIDQLNEINRRFYLDSAQEFHGTRRGPWVGWRRVLELARPALGHRDPLRVLDLGCGNGRFLELLQGAVDYLGVDFSPALLDHARSLAVAVDSARFLRLDLVRESLAQRVSAGGFDLVVALGLLHHIPGHDSRRRLLAEGARSLSEGGLLAVSFWDFERVSRLRDLRVPWSRASADGGPEVDPSDLEPGDQLLHFGQNSDTLRYCHFADLTERHELIAAAGLALQAEFRADGRERDLNHYFLLRRA